MGQNAEKEAGLQLETDGEGAAAPAADPMSPTKAKAEASLSAGLLETYMQRFELSREAVIEQKRVFDVLDVDGSDEIKLSEVKAKLAELAEGGGDRKLTDEEIDAQFKELDVDGSGGVTFQEFLKVYVKSEFGRDTKIAQADGTEQVHDLTYEKPDSRKSVHVLPSLGEDEEVLPCDEPKPQALDATAGTDDPKPDEPAAADAKEGVAEEAKDDAESGVAAGSAAGWLAKDDAPREGGGGESDGGGGGSPKSKEKARESKQRTLEQMMSLKPGDDERTELSKKISWILRHGAKKVSIAITEDGWVRLRDLSSSEILSGVPEEKLMSIVEESNAQKIRYEMRDEDDGTGQQIRAISKTERAGTIREQRRTRNKGEEGEDGGQGGWEPRQPRERRMMKADEPSGGDNGDGERDQHRPTFEQQLRDGFRPVYQGDKIVAMVRNDESVRPGRGAPEKGDGKGYREQRGDNDRGRGYGYRDGYPNRRDYRRDDRKDGGRDDRRDDRGERLERRDTRVERGDREDRNDEGRPPRRDREEERAMQDRRPRWRVNPGEDVILRDTDNVQSTVVCTLYSGTVVAQIGEETILPNGIIRMQVEVLEPNPGAAGWVTRTAEAAGGPVFFRPERNDRRNDYRGGHGRGRGGKGDYDDRDRRNDRYQRDNRDQRDDREQRDQRDNRDNRDYNRDYNRDHNRDHNRVDNRGDNRGGNYGGYRNDGFNDGQGGNYGGHRNDSFGDSRGDNRNYRADTRDHRDNRGDGAQDYARRDTRDPRVDQRGDRPMKGGGKGGKRKPDYDGGDWQGQR